MRPQDKSGAGRKVKADKPISKRGWPVPHETVPGAHWNPGTPKYIQAAVDQAERNAKSKVRSFGGGTPEAARHRVSGAWDKGKPNDGKTRQFHNPMKQTPC